MRPCRILLIVVDSCYSRCLLGDMSKVRVCWGKEQWEVERTELSSLQALKELVHVFFKTINRNDVEVDPRETRYTDPVLSQPLHIDRGGVLRRDRVIRSSSICALPPAHTGVYQIWLDSQVSERVLLLFHSIHYVPLPRRTATRMARYNA